MKYYIFKLNDWNINELKKLLNNRELFKMYENYQRVRKIFTFIFYSFPIVLILSIILTGNIYFYNNYLWWVGIFSLICVVLYLFIISPIYEWGLQRKMNYAIYKELDTNLSLKKFYEQNDRENIITNISSIQSFKNNPYDNIDTKIEVKDLPKYLKEFEK